MARLELSRRESEVARLVAEGLTNRQIAQRLFVAERTAEFHVEQIRNKLGFNTRAQIASWVAGGAADAARSAPAARLPTPLTRLIGREQEIDATSRLVREARLVTITGPGGIGKTRLAVEVARRVAPDLDGQVWLVELAALSDGRLIAERISNALYLAQAGAEPAEAQIIRFLSSRTVMLVVDNCEHVVRDCAGLVERLLSQGASLKVLATSREPLGVIGERVLRLGPLSFRGDAEGRSDAVELFAQRSREAGGTDVTPDNIADATTICARLDGVPLAIELAAAQTVVLPLGDIATKLDHRFKLLSSAARTSPPRHQTLRAAVEWSYQLLTDGERRAFRYLSVFPSLFDLEAAARMLETDDVSAAAVVGDLIRKSMLVSRESADGNRYQMLETLQQFGRDRLDEAREAASVLGRHAALYRERAQASFPRLRASDSDVWVQRLDLDRDSIAMALETLANTQPDQFIEMAAALGRYWLRGRRRDGYPWVERAIALSRARSRPDVDLLEAWAWLTWQAEQVQPALEAVDEMLRVARDLNDDAHLGRALNMKATFRTDWGLPIEPDLWRSAEVHLRRSGDGWALALLLNDVGFDRVVRGDAQLGLRQIEEALDLAREVGDGWLVALIIDSAAWAYLELGRVEAAVGLWTEGIHKIRTAPDRWVLPSYLEGFARVARLEGDPERSCTLFAAAAAVRSEIGASPTQEWAGFLQDDLSAVRESLGPAKFETCWEGGLRMTADEAVGESLRRPAKA